MTDGEGTTFSHYDALGRMDWEERNISGVGYYKLTYEYNPAGQLKKIIYPWQFGSVQVTYGYDKAGRLNSVGGSGYAGVSTYASSISYRAFGSLKGMSYGDGTALSTAYDRRLRATKWDVAGVLGYKYYYDDFDEHTGRVTFAQHITGLNPSLDRSQTSSSLDRSYEYDHVGRLSISHAGAEARAHAWTGQWGTADGHYSQGYDYDVWGNVTHRYGWGGEVQQGSPSSSTDLYYTYANGGNGVVNNRRGGPNFAYDNAGNLTFDGGQHFTYDARGNQVEVDWMSIRQGYDGDGLRVRRTADNTNPARYLRSGVLGGQVVAELGYHNNTWAWRRGYVYAGPGLLAVQQDGVYFIHEDPVTKGKRVTSTSGAVQSAAELDPYGAEAGGSNAAFQPRKFTTYERDPNGTDEAMFRRYNRWHARFDQPDPYDGSYDTSDPQSFNRYAYTNNDPVNFVDPTGLMCYNVIRTDVYSDTGEVIGSMVVGSFCTGGGWRGHPGRGAAPQRPAPDRANSVPAQADWQSCADFVNYLVSLAVNLRLPSGYTGRGSAEEIGAANLSIRLLSESFDNYNQYIDNRTDGFRSELTANGQNAGVYSHVLGMSGAYLSYGIGSYLIGSANSFIDWAQQYVGMTEARQLEAQAERAGNSAGWRVGQHMWNYISGATPREEHRLRNSLTSELCN